MKITGTNIVDSSEPICHDFTGVWSLWKLMIETEIGEIAACLLSLERRKGVYASLAEQLDGGGELDTEALVALDGDFSTLREACTTAGFRMALQTLATSQLFSHPDGGGFHSYTAAQSEISHVTNAVWNELKDRHFFHLLPEYSKYYEHRALFGEEVASAFPSAAVDIKEAGSCFAAGRNTATVFHLMRSVEWGLRALCGHVGLRQARRPRKSGKREYIPLAYADWEVMLNQLQPKVEARISRLKRGTQKQAEQEFFYPVLQDIRGIRDAWRNHVMHTRGEYNLRETEAIFGHVRRIMRTLAKRLASPASKGATQRPKIHLAKYGIGTEYLDVTTLLRGYVAHDMQVFASNHFFSDPFPSMDKHLYVEYSLPPSRAKKILTVREGDALLFKGVA